MGFDHIELIGKWRKRKMSDKYIATIARKLAEAMMTRARTRLAEDQKLVLELQTQLCRAVYEEKDEEEA